MSGYTRLCVFEHTYLALGIFNKCLKRKSTIEDESGLGARIVPELYLNV